VVKDASIAVLSVEVNAIPDSQFEFEPPPGALLTYDARLPDRAYPVQTVPGGEELLDRLAEWERSRAPQAEPREARRSYGWLAGLLVVPVILVLEAARRVLPRRLRSLGKSGVPA
jgi:hypothetical protein